MNEFQFEVQWNPDTYLPDLVLFTEEENRILIHRACSDMEDYHSLAPEAYATFVELIGQPMGTPVVTAVRKAVEEDRKGDVVRALEKLGKVEFSSHY